jgi:hypothetical protein
MSVAPEAVFRLEGRRAYPSAAAGGPWDPHMQHGAAPAALVAHAAERSGTAEAKQVARLTMEFVRPVPVGELDVEAEVVRDGRKVQLVEIRLRASGAEVVRARALKVRPASGLEHATALAAQPIPNFEDARPLEVSPGAESAFIGGVSMRLAEGSRLEPGWGKIWFRLDRELIAGQRPTPLQRAAATADFCNGTSAALDPSEWTFINADLSLSLARMPIGEWILLDAETWLGPDGVAVAVASLADMHGYFARATQSLVIDRR